MLDDADLKFLALSLEEAEAGHREGGVPIGSVLRRGDDVVARGRNRRVQQGDPMAHAEIDCLRNAGRQPSYRDTILYSTLMPCYLCAGAVIQFGIPRVVVGEARNFEGAGSLLREHGVLVEVADDPRCRSLLGEFITARPDVWNEDIGE